MPIFVSRRYALVGLLAIALSFPFLSRGLIGSSEGRYAEAARAITATGDIMIPRLDGSPHLTKPPLTYWLISAGITLFGPTSVACRFFHAVAWVILTLAVVRIGDLLENADFGLLTGLIFTSAFFPALGSCALTTDPLVVAFQGGAFLSLLEAVHGRRCRNSISLWNRLFWLFIGCAFLTKGPVALLPLAFWLPWYSGKTSQLWKPAYWLPGLVVGVGWYLALETHEPGILRRLFHDELYLRSTTDISQRNPDWWAPISVYFLPVFLGFGAWSVAWHRPVLYKLRFLRSPNWPILMAIWILASLLFFSFLKSRLTLYILPLSLPLSLISAWLWREKFGYRTQAMALRAFAFNAVVLLFIKIGVTFFWTSNQNAEQVARFVRKRVPVGPVFLYEEANHFGLSFYLHDRLVKFSASEPRRAAVHSQADWLNSNRSTSSPIWVLARHSRFADLNSAVKSIGRSAEARASFGSWDLVECR